MSHPLDPVEKALVAVSNALNESDFDGDIFPIIDKHIDRALQLVQDEIDLDAAHTVLGRVILF